MVRVQTVQRASTRQTVRHVLHVPPDSPQVQVLRRVLRVLQVNRVMGTEVRALHVQVVQVPILVESVYAQKQWDL